MSTTLQKLQRLAQHQPTWQAMSAADKLVLLQTMRSRVATYEGYTTASQACATGTMGLSLTTAQGQFAQATEHVMMVTFSAGILDYLIQAYRVMSGAQPAPPLPVRTIQQQQQQQVAVQVFPLLPDETSGPLSQVVGEVYLDPARVKSPADVTAFDWNLVGSSSSSSSSDKDDDDHDSPSKGAAIVLGAGNFSMLTTEDVFSTLFRDNRVCLVKHHRIREYLDDFLRYLLQPLQGFVDFEMDADFNRTVLHTAPLDVLAAVHMTGGKATHDAIVWGTSSQPNKGTSSPRSKPLLQAQMTSELGCITPWIIPQCDLTDQELLSQATSLAKAVYQNCSFMCNSPKVLVVSHAWSQRDEFIDLVVQYLRTHTTPVAYYPGARQRWQAYKDRAATPQCMEIGCHMNVHKRKLQKPAWQNTSSDDGVCLLPWLVNPITVDLTTPQGKTAAAKHYALRHEPFAPILTICTIQSTKSPQDYLETAVTLCNDYIFGSLSATLTVPSALQDDASIDQALADLRYGSITTNAWSGFPYIMKGLPWGAHPGERLEAVESGIGSIHSYCFIPHVVKGVARFPPTGAPPMAMMDATRDNAMVSRAIAKVVQRHGMWAIFNLLLCMAWVQIKGLLKAMHLWKEEEEED